MWRTVSQASQSVHGEVRIVRYGYSQIHTRALVWRPVGVRRVTWLQWQVRASVAVVRAVGRMVGRRI